MAVTVPQETLTCEHPAKPHKWKRDAGKRGRKPRFCPKHIPQTSVTVPGTPRELYCELGKHKWNREPSRGRVPTSCPEHRTQLVIQSAPRNENGKETLHCEIGNHDWERIPTRGRKPHSCPVHSAPVTNAKAIEKMTEQMVTETVKRKGGRPKLYNSPEEQAEAALQKSRKRAEDLEIALKANGTHISQQTPYILYRKVGEKKGRGKNPPTTEWERVAEHSPLAQAQYILAHEKDFTSGAYRYERNNKVIDLGL